MSGTKIISSIVRKVLKEFYHKNLTENIDKKYQISEIKYFSPDGIKKIPNGHPLQKGGFIKECVENSKRFKTGNNQYLINEDMTISEAVHPNQYGLMDYRGGIIIFSTEVNSLDVSEVKVFNFIAKKLKSIRNRIFSKSKLNKVIKNFNDAEKMLSDEPIEDYIGAFSIGNFFSGRYIGDNEKVFNERSLSIEINGISTKGLMFLAEEIAKEFDQETVLVKDLNVNKIYLMNQERGGNYDIANLNIKTD